MRFSCIQLSIDRVEPLAENVRREIVNSVILFRRCKYFVESDAYLFKTFLLTAIVAVAAVAASAQLAGPGSRPFEVGEVLTYEGKVSKIIQGISVADLKFAVEKAADSDNFLIKTEAVSKGTLLKLFRFSFLQQYESLIDREAFRILKTTKHDVQKERVRNGLAAFDYEDKRVNYTETDPKDPESAAASHRLGSRGSGS